MTESIVRHSCHDSGICFNDEHRLKFGVFDDCWQTEDWHGEVRQSRVRPTDVDMLIEVRGNFLLQEWKYNEGVFLPKTGQGILFRMLVVRAPFTVILIEGSPRLMEVRRMAVLHGGYDSGPWDATTEDLKAVLKQWSRWASRHPAPAVVQRTATVPTWLL